MTWAYRLCKQTIDDKLTYSLREVYMNDEEEIWGVTENSVNPIDWLEEEVERVEDEEALLEDVFKCLLNIVKDCSKGVLDLDTIVYADHGFGDFSGEIDGI